MLDYNRVLIPSQHSIDMFSSCDKLLPPSENINKALGDTDHLGYDK